MNELIIPCVHNNGTSRDDLLKQMFNAALAVQNAIDKLCDATPHGRDYYPLGDAAFKTARDQHRSRLAKLNDVLQELQHIGEELVGK